MKNRQSNEQRSRNENYMLWSKLAVRQSFMLRMLPEPVRRNCVLTLLMLGTLSAGCAQLPTVPCPTPEPITRPVLSQPLPPVNYSISAEQSIKAWQKKLTDMSATSKP